MEDNPDTPQAVAAIDTLIEYIKQLHSGKLKFPYYLKCIVFVLMKRDDFVSRIIPFQKRRLGIPQRQVHI